MRPLAVLSKPWLQPLQISGGGLLEEVGAAPAVSALDDAALRLEGVAKSHHHRRIDAQIDDYLHALAASQQNIQRTATCQKTRSILHSKACQQKFFLMLSDA